MNTPSYCPVCSVFLKTQGLERCLRCGADIAREQERKERHQSDLRRKNELVEGPFHPVLGISCPVCGEDVEVLPMKVEEFIVQGQYIGHPGLGEKRADTKAFVGLQPWRCRKGHQLFSTFDVEWRELCPGCKEPNNAFGKLVRSCPRCSIMVPVGLYRRTEPMKMLLGKGYYHAPQFEKEGGKQDVP